MAAISARQGVHPPALGGVLAVCAHPDDEAFGLGAILHAFAATGTRLGVLCFTHGEASTLHAVDGDLSTIRAQELDAAGQILGVGRVTLLDYPDGSLAAQPSAELAAHVVRVAGDVDALVVFDHGGITGHPDHQAATDAALTAAVELDVPVIGWMIPATVADTLNREFATSFVGRQPDDADTLLIVDRTAQHAAIDCHRSQATDNPVLRRRLELMADREWVRWLR